MKVAPRFPRLQESRCLPVSADAAAGKRRSNCRSHCRRRSGRSQSPAGAAATLTRCCSTSKGASRDSVAHRPWRKSRVPAARRSERQGLRQSALAARISPKRHSSASFGGWAAWLVISTDDGHVGAAYVVVAKGSAADWAKVHGHKGREESSHPRLRGVSDAYSRTITTLAPADSEAHTVCSGDSGPDRRDERVIRLLHRSVGPYRGRCGLPHDTKSRGLDLVT